MLSTVCPRLSTAVHNLSRRLGQMLLLYQPIWLANRPIEQYHFVCPNVQAFWPTPAPILHIIVCLPSYTFIFSYRALG